MWRDKLFFWKKESAEPEPDPRSRVFKDYDIRGTYPAEVNEQLFERIADTFYGIHKPKTVAVGRDSRPTSLALARALGNRFMAHGVEVQDIGLATAPRMFWVAKTKRIASFFVTASHNPSDQNGLKVYMRSGEALAGESLLEFARLALVEPSPDAIVPVARGILRSQSYKSEYEKFVDSLVGTIHGSPSVALDYLHGTVGQELNEILDSRRISFSTLREDPSGRFPSDGPNPLMPENQSALGSFIREGKFACGALFDGDGDRVLFFDEKGEAVSTGAVASLFIQYFFSTEKHNRSVVVPVNFSRIIERVAAEYGGRVYRSRVGRTNLSPLMRAKRAVFGAERSGHYFFKSFHYADNAILAFLLLLKILGESKRTKFSVLTAPYSIYTALPELDIPYIPGTESRVFRAVRNAFPGGRFSRIDGITIEYRDWWFNVRRSRTQAFWRISVEAEQESRARERLESIEQVVRNASGAPKLKA